MTRFVWLGVALQMLMVVAGHFSEAVIDLSALLGMGIPFALGIGYGVTVPRSFGEAAKGGAVIGFVGALVGVLAAVLMGDQPWMLLTFAPVSSAVTGLLGAVIGTAAGGRRKAAA